MDIMFELTRRCDMQCSHCLRGDAQGVDMSSHMIRTILLKLEDIASNFSFGGGEAILKPELINQFTQELHWSGINTQWLEPMWIVSNGKRLYNIDDPYNPSELTDALIRLSNYVPITLAISTDKYHEDGADSRYNHAEYLFEHTPDIQLCKHGPRDYSNLVDMGRFRGGREVKEAVNEDDLKLFYINIHGDIFPSCDLSYNFMDEFKDTAICFGNILTDTLEDIMTKRQKLIDICIFAEEDYVYLTEDSIGDLEEWTEDYNNHINNNELCA